MSILCWHTKNKRCKRRRTLPAHPHLCFFSFYRSTYCAASVASLTNILTPQLFENTTNWILRYSKAKNNSLLLLKTILCLHFSSNQRVHHYVFNALFFCLQLSELGGWSERSAGFGGPRWLHFLWHSCPCHPGQRTHAGSQSLAGEGVRTPDIFLVHIC